MSHNCRAHPCDAALAEVAALFALWSPEPVVAPLSDDDLARLWGV